MVETEYLLYQLINSSTERNCFMFKINRFVNNLRGQTYNKIRGGTC